jgi:hypothetical protein
MMQQQQYYANAMSPQQPMYQQMTVDGRYIMTNQAPMQMSPQYYQQPMYYTQQQIPMQPGSRTAGFVGQPSQM